MIISPARANCDAHPLFKATYPLVGAHTFESAVATILGSVKIADQAANQSVADAIAAIASGFLGK